MTPWRPTPALVTAASVACGLIVIAVMTHDPGLVVLAAPLLAITTWSLLTRPDSSPRVVSIRSTGRSTERVLYDWSLAVEGLEGAETFHAVTRSSPFVHTDPVSGVLCTQPSGGSATLSMRWSAHRWGPAEVGTGSCVAWSRWSGFRTEPLPFGATRVRVTPAVPPFTAAAGTPRPAGNIGQNRSFRRGDGSEFADLRAYQQGDRLQRIHWPISARTGRLHVRTTYAELDSEVLLVLDAQGEYGDQGIDLETSLDVGVRACAAMAGHLLQRGERVGLRVLGGGTAHLVRSRGGSGQLRRILYELSGVQAGVSGPSSSARSNRIDASRGTLIVVVTPLIGTVSTTLAAAAAQRGLPTVLVDSLPPASSSIDAAGRLSLLQRQVQIDNLQRHGLAVVPWHGPGSLDPVLRRMAAAGVGSRIR